MYCIFCFLSVLKSSFLVLMNNVCTQKQKKTTINILLYYVHTTLIYLHDTLKR